MLHRGFADWAGRLAEEEERLDAVNDALDALDTDRFHSAVRRINDLNLTGCAARIADSRDILDAERLLEELYAAILLRIEYIRPLAREEELGERGYMDWEYERGV